MRKSAGTWGHSRGKETGHICKTGCCNSASAGVGLHYLFALPSALSFARHQCVPDSASGLVKSLPIILE